MQQLFLVVCFAPEVLTVPPEQCEVLLAVPKRC